jgi:hypothetical protein
MIQDLTHALVLAGVNALCVIGIIIIWAVILGGQTASLTDTPSYSSRLVITEENK